jgi:8-oxo-dGTP pyrophosphatase MutT (NUDIX family)
MTRRKFHFLVRGVILVEGHVLVAQALGTDFTFLPGGHAESGEGLTTALVRELREEVGVACTVGAYLGAVEYSWEDERNVPHYEVNHVFEASAPLSPRTVVESLEPQFQLHWAPLDALEAVDLRPEPLPALIRRWAAGDSSIWWKTNVTD